MIQIKIDGRDQVLHQWDKGQRLILEGVEPGTRLDFAYSHDDKATPEYAYEETGAVYCAIPDGLLMRYGTLLVYIYVEDGIKGETVCCKTLFVRARAKPDDYVEPEQVLTWHELAERIEALENGGGGNDSPGADDGYYTPSVSQPDENTMQVNFTPSSESMPTVEPVTVALPVGPEGDPGVTPEISIGTVETLDAGSDATASITGTPEKPVLNLGIPRGPAGASGSEGDTQGTLVASYTHTGNLEVAVEHIDYGTGTITAQGHGLSENDMIYATVTDAVHTAAPLAPEPYLPGGIAYASRFYAVNVTDDTFQLASAESGDPIAITEKSTADFSRWHFERDTDRYGSSIALSGLGRFVNFRVRVVGKQVQNNRFDSYVVQGATSYISNAVDNPDGYGDSSYGIGARMMNGNIKFAFDSVVMYDGTRYRISRKGVASCNKVGDMWSVTSRDLALECVSVDCAPVPVDEIVFWNCYPANGTTVEVYKL